MKQKKENTLNPIISIFISHIHEEKEIALALKKWIKKAFSNKCKIFVSSDKEDIELGQKWLDKIDEALLNSTLFLVILSKKSIQRPWINFESGAAWIKKINIIPVCHSGISAGKLPKPYDIYEGININENNFSEIFFKDISKKMRSSGSLDINFKEVDAIMNKLLRSISTEENKIEKKSIFNGTIILNEKEEKILIFLSIQKNERIKISQVENFFKVSAATAKHHLEELHVKSLIMPRTFYDQIGFKYRAYMLTQKGRTYLVKNKLIK